MSSDSMMLPVIINTFDHRQDFVYVGDLVRIIKVATIRDLVTGKPTYENLHIGELAMFAGRVTPTPEFAESWVIECHDPSKYAIILSNNRLLAVHGSVLERV